MNISKLGGLLPGITADPSASKSTPKNDAGTTISHTAAKPADVKLSPLSEKLKALVGEYAANAAFDSQKVDALKAAMANGTFKVNAEAVADKMISEAHDLTGKKS